jgi:flagellin
VRILTNVESIQARRRLSQLQSVEDREMNRLSSGDRILSASSDPSGLAISSVMKSEIRSRYQAQRNINDGISLLQIAESTLGTIQEMATRLKELSIAAATDTLGDQERGALNNEFFELKREYERQKNTASFNGKPVLGDQRLSYDLQVGIQNSPDADRIVYNLNDVLSQDFGFKQMDISSKTGARDALGQVDSMIDELSRSRSHIGSISNRMEAALGNLTVSTENQQAANSLIRDTNIAESTALRAVTQINKEATTKALKYVNKNPERVSQLL